jgi:hypothetical protein
MLVLGTARYTVAAAMGVSHHGQRSNAGVLTGHRADKEANTARETKGCPPEKVVVPVPVGQLDD